MCEITPNGRLGWRGWRQWAEAAPPRPTGPWHDLSHQLHDELPIPHVLPKPSFRRVMSMPAQPMNVTHIDMACHIGTHVDAPLRFLMDGPAFHQIPASRLHGSGVVWHVDVEPFGAIGRDMLQGQRPALREGDMLLLHTGWAQRFGTDTYLDNRALTVEAAQWLVAQGVKLLGVDFATPDLALPKRLPGFDWPVHQVLLSNGVLVAENLAEFGHLVGERIELVCGAPNIRGADGSPARILARTIAA